MNAGETKTVRIDMVDITPTTDGYANMARMFAASVLDDARLDRQHDTGKLLIGLVDILVYLAATQPIPVVQKLVTDIKRNAERPQIHIHPDSQ